MKLKPLVLGRNEVSYDSRVKISNWQNKFLREPRDNTEFFPPKGHLQISTYKQLGINESQNYLTETKEKIKEYKIENFQKCSKSTQLLNIHSFPLQDSLDEKRKSSNDGKYSLKNMQIEELPESIFRRTLGYSLEDLEKFEGIRTFLDDDLEIMQKIFKLKRYNR
ncbi:uncharacterized protein LOC127277272 isoform X2 [Leptopilina boulardi]|nr:uncharacterized protein LOC127277272 isoform X2 [Leptopilina boulardi]